MMTMEGLQFEMLGESKCVQIRSNIGGRETANSRVPTPKPLRTRASRRGRVQTIALSTMRLDRTARGVSGGAKKTGEMESRPPRVGEIRGRGATPFSSPKPRFCVGPASEMKGGGARERARAAHLLVVLVEILVRVGHLPRHRLRLIVQDGFIPDDGQRLGDVDGPSPERGTRHLPRKPAPSRCPRIYGFPITARGLPPSGPMAR